MIDTAQLKYALSHEWVSVQDNGEWLIGITDHAQQQLGDIVFIELPEVGLHGEAQSACLLIESVKAASDIYLPASGRVTAINNDLEDEPELVNESPYQQGWLFKMLPDNADDISQLHTLAQYQAAIADD